MADEVKDEVKNEVVDDGTEKAVEAVQKIIEKNVEDESKEVKDEDVDGKVKVDDEPTKEETKESKDVSKEGKADTTDETKKTIDSLKLPSRLVQAAKRSHMSDEDVIKLGDNAELVLLRLADGLDTVSMRLGEMGRQAKLKTPEVEQKEVKPTTLKLPEDYEDTEFGKQLQEIVVGLNSQIAELKGQMSSEREQSTKVSALEQDKKIDAFFDGISKDFTEFGDSKQLTDVSLVMRQNLFATADNIMVGAKMNGTDVSLEDALTQALSIYEGKNPKRVKETLVKEAKKRNKQLMSRPFSKKGADTTVVSDEGAAVKAVADLMKEKGMRGWS